MATQAVTGRRFPRPDSGIFKTYCTCHLTLFILISFKSPALIPHNCLKYIRYFCRTRICRASSLRHPVSIGQEFVRRNFLYWKRHWTTVCWEFDIWHRQNGKDPGEGLSIRQRWHGPTPGSQSCLAKMQLVAVCMCPKYLSPLVTFRRKIDSRTAPWLWTWAAEDYSERWAVSLPLCFLGLQVFLVEISSQKKTILGCEALKNLLDNLRKAERFL